MGRGRRGGVTCEDGMEDGIEEDKKEKEVESEMNKEGGSNTLQMCRQTLPAIPAFDMLGHIATHSHELRGTQCLFMSVQVHSQRAR